MLELDKVVLRSGTFELSAEGGLMGVPFRFSVVAVMLLAIAPFDGLLAQARIVEWVETEKNSDGTVKAGWPRTYTSELVVGREAAPTDQKMRLNPLRIMVTELRWKPIN